jgi:hypothetical protein
LETDAGRVKNDEVQSVEQGVRHGLDEMISKVVLIEHSAFTQTGESKAIYQIAAGMILGIGNNRHETGLGSEYRPRRLPPGWSVGDEDSQLDRLFMVARLAGSPTVFGHPDYRGMVGPHVNGETVREHNVTMLQLN